MSPRQYGTLDTEGTQTESQQPSIVDAAGFVVGNGLVFPATQVPSADANTLDDYEEGTWTPVLTFATPGDLSVAYSTQIGTYTKIGRIVHWACRIDTSTFTHTTASGTLRVTGLPFTVAALGHVGACALAGWTKAGYTQIVAWADGTMLIFLARGSGQAGTTLGTGDMPTGGTVTLYAAGSYRV